MNEKEKLYDTLLQLGTALREKRVHVYGVGWDLHKRKWRQSVRRINSTWICR